MENKLKDKISIGLSLSISIDEYKRLFDKYQEYLHSIYYSPPFGKKFHSRSQIVEQFQDKENVKKFYQILELAKNEGIILDCVLNLPSLKDEDIEKNIDELTKLPMDQITCLKKHIDLLDDKFPSIPKIYSYNNDFKMKDLADIPHKFETIVVGKYFLRSPDLLKEIYNNGFKLKILVNNGCSYNCQGCNNGNIKCLNTFNKNLQEHSVEYLYALQSFYPDELEKLLDDLDVPFDSIKISNRTDGYEYLDNCLESYIFNNDPSNYTDISSKNYRLYSRLAHFNPYLDELNQEKIVKIKKKW